MPALHKAPPISVGLFNTVLHSLSAVTALIHLVGTSVEMLVQLYLFPVHTRETQSIIPVVAQSEVKHFMSSRQINRKLKKDAREQAAHSKQIPASGGAAALACTYRFSGKHLTYKERSGRALQRQRGEETGPPFTEWAACQ